MIGIIVPVYKVEPYLHRCVDSVLRQTMQDFKILLIDDGSPDKCPEICDEYAASDERITVIHQKNQGVAAARNVGIDYFLKDEAIEHIAFVDSDDWLHPQYLESLHEAMKGDAEIDIVQCNFISTEEYIAPKCDAEAPGGKLVISGMEAQKLSMRIEPILWAKLYKKSVFTTGVWGKVYFPSGKQHEDTFTVWKICLNAHKIVKLENPLYYYFLRSDSIMGQPFNEKRLYGYEAYIERLIFYKSNRPTYDLAANELGTSELFRLSWFLDKTKKGKEFRGLQRKLKKVYFRLLFAARPFIGAKFFLERLAHGAFPELCCRYNLRRQNKFVE